MLAEHVARPSLVTPLLRAPTKRSTTSGRVSTGARLFLKPAARSGSSHRGPPAYSRYRRVGGDWPTRHRNDPYISIDADGPSPGTVNWPLRIRRSFRASSEQPVLPNVCWAEPESCTCAGRRLFAARSLCVGARQHIARRTAHPPPSDPETDATVRWRAEKGLLVRKRSPVVTASPSSVTASSSSVAASRRRAWTCHAPSSSSLITTSSSCCAAPSCRGRCGRKKKDKKDTGNNKTRSEKEKNRGQWRRECPRAR
mmetsp:Transcript_18027/g.55205  ORF Transcript_18027/g.55205 Transcript_18027/m.55205 type:complete len:255 (-) Transcript_18027:1239-2003(-)